jgi:hypothetical protein
MPHHAHGQLRRVECTHAPAAVFERSLRGIALHPSSDSWYRHAVLADGSSYVGWTTVGEFLVSPDGLRILCRPARRSTSESFQVYLLGQALSFALVQQRLEPLHATAVTVHDQAIAFLGPSAFGKSTLAASFVAAGHRLLTDDLLNVNDVGTEVVAYPGPARIKLFAEVARRVLGLTAGVAMNADTGKLIVGLPDHQSCSHPMPLKTLYVLAEPGGSGRRRRVAIEPLSRREGFVELVRATFNRRLGGRRRVGRQFELMTSLTRRTIIKRLIYPRTIECLPEVRARLLEDL